LTSETEGDGHTWKQSIYRVGSYRWL